ncbi:MAG TPA: sigma-70 family RNA polymerase sigma factor [Anaerolineales bacterium]|nr:sigma-70 family RNA polymerase sigma factor [Anaerolineales bacterium]
MSLIAQSQEGALAQLYDRYSRLVFSLAVAIVQDQPTAEEITLDVFMRVWQKAAMYRSEQAKVRTWLTHITRHHAIDVLRRRAVRPEQYAIMLDDEASGPEEPPSQNPADAAEASMQRKRIHSALARLPNEQRQALFLAYFEGYTQQQIAETLKQPLGTIKTRIRLALQKLRDFLQDERERVDTSVDVPPAYNISKEE